MPDVLPHLEEAGLPTGFGLEDETAEPPARKGERLGRQAQLPLAPGFEEISPIIAPLTKATATAAGEEPVILIDPSERSGDSVIAFWAY